MSVVVRPNGVLVRWGHLTKTEEIARYKGLDAPKVIARRRPAPAKCTQEPRPEEPRQT